MFSETARLYDVVHSGKDYAGEAAYVRGVLGRAYQRRPLRTLETDRRGVR